jgi:hypothetical protein
MAHKLIADPYRTDNGYHNIYIYAWHTLIADPCRTDNGYHNIYLSQKPTQSHSQLCFYNSAQGVQKHEKIWKQENSHLLP